MPRRFSPVLAAAAAAIALASCSSVSNGDPTTASAAPDSQSVSASGPSSSAETTPTSFPSSSEDSSGSTGGGGLSESQALAALLTAADLGGGFADDTPADDQPLPCTPNEPPLSEQFPARVNVEKAFSAQSGAVYFGEQIETFADSATAGQVVTAGTKGLACKTATVNGAKVTITGPQDLSTNITTPVDQAKGWSISQGSGAGQGIVAVQLGQHLVVLTFASASTANTDSLPDSAKLANEAISRVAAAIP